MPQPSFQLTPDPGFKLRRSGAYWYATKSYPTRGAVRVSCGKGSRADAERAAVLAFEKRDRAAAAGRKAGETKRARAAARLAASSPPTPLRPKPTPPPQDPPADPPPAAAGPDPRAEQIRARLAAMGDRSGAGASNDNGDDRAEASNDNAADPDMGDEETELFADVVGGLFVVAYVKGLNNFLLKRGKRGGEPSSRMLDWFREGLAHHIKKLVGSRTRLGPTGKMLFGLLGVTVTIVFGAEPIARGSTPPDAATVSADSRPTSADATPTPPPQDPPAEPPPAASHVNGASLGVFR